MPEPESTTFNYHSPLAMPEGEMLTANLHFTVNETEIQTQIPVPQGKAKVRIMLPVFRAFGEAFILRGVQKAAEEGRHVSCRAHCGACCRQLVPISEPEAYHLMEVIGQMPAERQAVLLQRFADARAKMEAAGVWERLQNALQEKGNPEVRSLALEYFHLGIACPFLEEESCSIHPERPLVCREYLVSNDPVHCASPQAHTIAMVPPAARMSTILAMINEDPPGSHGRFVMLTALPSWAAEHPEQEAAFTGPEILTMAVSLLVHKQVKPTGLEQADPGEKENKEKKTGEKNKGQA